MEVKGSPSGIARRALRSRSIVLSGSLDSSKAINVEFGAMFAVRRSAGAAATAEIWGLLDGDTAFTRLRDKSGTDLSVPLGSSLTVLPEEAYVCSQIQLLAADATVVFGGKT